ncbi:MAG: tRNA lysidine(34) synthetase TilS [Desulfuromonas sp.]|nr:MAG: tRNA lysidine(34) synthetase TilS [Desulfuromonas sp.]
MTDMLKRLEQVLRTDDLVADDEKLLVAVSGGADSMALLHLLAELAPAYPFSLAVAHLDHQLRPESAADAGFVANVCHQLQLELFQESVDVRQLATTRKTGIEVAGRQARRSFFERLARQQKCAKIVLAHHGDDQAETILFRLLRGSGLSGLAAMRLKADRYLRPLLGFRADELREYLQQRNLSWRDDSSNDDIAFTRNRIRHQLMPQLAEYNPNLVDALNRLAGQAADEEDYWARLSRTLLDEHGESADDGCIFPIAVLESISRAERRRLLRAFLRQVHNDLSGLEAGHIDQIEALISGSRPQADLDLPGLWVGRRYGRLLCSQSRPEVEAFELSVPGPGDYALPSGDLLRVSINGQGEEDHRTVLFPASALRFPLVVRSPRPGDRFQPSGMEGTRLVKDYFIDAKVEREERLKTPVVCTGEEIIWLAGKRRCGRYFPVGNEKLLKITLLTPKQAVE